MKRCSKLASWPALVLGVPLALGAMLPVPGAAAAGPEDFCYGASDGHCLPPSQWPGICVAGNTAHQSPLDLHETSVAALPVWIPHYAEHDAVTVITNGHTLEVDLEEEADTLAVVGTKHCELRQFHFHTPAEHLIGGVSFPVEAHLVHQCDDGRLLVIGVLLDYLTNEPNRALAAALDNAARDADGTFAEGTVTTAGVPFSAADLLPPVLSRGYFHYLGSLTTPPCNEVVDWYVLKTPVGINEEQVAGLKELLRDTSPNGFDANNRPIQEERPTNRRGRSLPF